MLNKNIILLTKLYDASYDEYLQYYYIPINIYEPYTYNITHCIDYNNNIIYPINQTEHSKKHRNINSEITLHRMYYKNANLKSMFNSISNYYNIIKMSDYIKPEIGYITQLQNGCLVVIKNTCWLKIFQRKVRNILIKKRN